MKKEDVYSKTAIEIYKMVLEGKEIKKFPNGFWQRPEALDNSIAIVEYLIEDILHWTDDDIKKNFNGDLLQKSKLKGMLTLVFKDSPYAVINTVYPQKIKPWEMQMCPINYWNKDTANEALDWLLNTKLKWTDIEICEKLNGLIFRANNLGGMLSCVYDDSVFDSLNNLYPGKFKPWQLKQAPYKYWNKETAKQAMLWLFNEELKWSLEDIKHNLTIEVFKKYDLGGMIKRVYGYNVNKALADVFPDSFNLNLNN